MNLTKYTAVVEAAEALATNRARDTWRLADAIRDAVRNDNSAEFQDLAERLEKDGLTKPSGESYDLWSLRRLWRVAILWPQDKRHAEASYRTHQEAGGPNDANGRMLTALCAAARGENATRPSHVDPINWSATCDRIRARQRGFKVTANDLRLVIGRLTNLPNRHGMAVASYDDRFDRATAAVLATQDLDDRIERDFASLSALTLLLQAERYAKEGATHLTSASAVNDEIRTCLDSIQQILDSVKALA